MAERMNWLNNSKAITQPWNLFYGCCSKTSFLYKQEIEYYKESVILHSISVAFSDEEGSPKQYVQDKVQEHSQVVYETLQNKNGVVMVCGRAVMMKAIHSLLPEMYTHYC